MPDWVSKVQRDKKASFVYTKGLTVEVLIHLPLPAVASRIFRSDRHPEGFYYWEHCGFAIPLTHICIAMVVATCEEARMAVCRK